jgi:peroxiredoxin family protein
VDVQKKKLSIVAFRGEFDRALAVFTLASGAAAVNYEVSIFFTFWGLNLIKKNPGRAWLGRRLLDRIFNFLMGGVANLRLSRFNCLGLSPLLMTHMMRKSNVATLPELIAASHALKVDFFACDMAMNIFGIAREDLIPEIREVLGVAGFLERARDGKVLFI